MAVGYVGVRTRRPRAAGEPARAGTTPTGRLSRASRYDVGQAGACSGHMRLMLIVAKVSLLLLPLAFAGTPAVATVETTRNNKSPSAATRANVVLMFLDDTGWGDFGANWNTQSSPSETPRLDEVARRGLRLTDFHAGASVCTPSRAALLTGRLGARTGITHNSGFKWLGGLPRSEPTIAEVVKTVGYDVRACTAHTCHGDTPDLICDHALLSAD